MLLDTDTHRIFLPVDSEECEFGIRRRELDVIGRHEFAEKVRKQARLSACGWSWQWRALPEKTVRDAGLSTPEP